MEHIYEYKNNKIYLSINIRDIRGKNCRIIYNLPFNVRDYEDVLAVLEQSFSDSICGEGIYDILSIHFKYIYEKMKTCLICYLIGLLTT